MREVVSPSQEKGHDLQYNLHSDGLLAAVALFGWPWDPSPEAATRWEPGAGQECPWEGFPIKPACTPWEAEQDQSALATRFSSYKSDSYSKDFCSFWVFFPLRKL